MVNLIVGPKGCGKTKKFIELTNNAALENPNCVVCIEKGSISTFSVSISMILTKSTPTASCSHFCAA